MTRTDPLTGLTIATSQRGRRPQAQRDWQCQECGHRMTLTAAERAFSGPNGCLKCGGSDIDLADHTVPTI